jgi:L-threonylcarbamoyladenylate synthase
MSEQKTLLLQIRAEQPQEDLIQQAASVICGGGLVAFPTETVYGLGADAMNEVAVQKIFQAKGRPADNPLIVHISSRPMLDRVALDVSKKAEALMARFWPGPLTLVLQRNEEVAPTVSAGLATVAVRMPNHKIALALISKADTPIAAPSANRSGRPSPTTAAHVLEDLNGRIAMILDGGQTAIGIESTVLDVTQDVPLILRPGWVTQEMLEEVAGEIHQAISEEELRRSPGTRYRHYSPRARLMLLENASAEFIHRICTELLKTERVGLISRTPVLIDEARFSAILLKDSAAEYARRIYGALRELDEKNVDAIVVEGIEEAGEGAAVMDRLRRAASQIEAE